MLRTINLPSNMKMLKMDLPKKKYDDKFSNDKIIVPKKHSFFNKSKKNIHHKKVQSVILDLS